MSEIKGRAERKIRKEYEGEFSDETIYAMIDIINHTQSPHFKNILSYVINKQFEEFITLAKQSKEKIGKFTKQPVQKELFSQLKTFWKRLFYIKRMKKLFDDVEKIEDCLDKSTSYTVLFDRTISGVESIRKEEKFISLEVSMQGYEYSCQIYLNQNHNGTFKPFEQILEERTQIRMAGNK